MSRSVNHDCEKKWPGRNCCLDESLSTGSDAAGPICSSSLEIGNGLVSHQPKKASVPLTVTSGC